MRLASVLEEQLDEELAAAGFAVLGDHDVMSVLRRAGHPLLPGEIADLLRMTRAGNPWSDVETGYPPMKAPNSSPCKIASCSGEHVVKSDVRLVNFKSSEAGTSLNVS